MCANSAIVSYLNCGVGSQDPKVHSRDWGVEAAFGIHPDNQEDILPGSGDKYRKTARLSVLPGSGQYTKIGDAEDNAVA